MFTPRPTPKIAPSNTRDFVREFTKSKNTGLSLMKGAAAAFALMLVVATVSMWPTSSPSPSYSNEEVEVITKQLLAEKGWY